MQVHLNISVVNRPVFTNRAGTFKDKRCAIGTCDSGFNALVARPGQQQHLTFNF
jgi:hypothetical protein